MANEALQNWLTTVVSKHHFAPTGGGTAQAAPPAGTRTTLEQQYEKLGGDKALLAVLESEDEGFRSEREKQRIQAKKWQNERNLELEEAKDERGSRVVWIQEKLPGLEAWLATESPLQESFANQVHALGDKLQTEPGKELLHIAESAGQRIERARSEAAHDRRWLAQAQPSLELIELRLRDVDKTYEAIERRIQDTRVELNNVLELKAMTLEEKVARLRGGGTKDERYQAAQKLDDELGKVYEEHYGSELEKGTYYWTDPSPAKPAPLDWASAQKKLAAVQAAKKEALEKQDPALAKLEKAYEKAGGDRALFEKRAAAWKEELQTSKAEQEGKSTNHRKEEAGLQERLNAAELTLMETERELDEMRARCRDAKARTDRMQAGSNAGDALSSAERAELQLLVAELKRLKKDIPNREALLPILRESTKNVKLLLERERQVYELEADDEAHPKPSEPKPEDLAKLPLRARYEELTGRGKE